METSEFRTLVIVLTCLCLLLGLFVLIFFLVYRKNQNTKENQIENLNKELLQTQIEIQEQTLKTISQEIHDNVGQVLSLAKLNLGTFEDTESAANQIKINDTKQLVSKAINDLRDLSRSLHGDRIAELGLHEAIANELKILQNTGQYQTSLRITGEAYKLEPQKEMVLFRIFQEAFHNAEKHSKAKNIYVQMVYEKEAFRLMIGDDGIGFDASGLQPGKTGIGLKSMQNRAALIGGALSIDSATGSGTTITIELKKT